MLSIFHLFSKCSSEYPAKYSLLSPGSVWRSVQWPGLGGGAGPGPEQDPDHRRGHLPGPGPPPPLIPTTAATSAQQVALKPQQQQPQPQQPLMSYNVQVAGNSQLTSPPPLIASENYAQLSLECQQRIQQQPTKPNIDLGAVVRSTIINGVTKAFTQVYC